jgi:site-specific recombinase XerD
MKKPINIIIKDKRFTKKKKIYITNELEGQRDQAILELFYSTGLRLSELLSINICDIDRKNEIVKVMGKGGKERVVPIGKVALNSIESYLKKLGKSIREYFEDPLFVNKKGKRLPKRTLQRRIKKYLVLTNIGGTVHTLRHTFATHLIDRGAGILTVKELLGHSSLSSTQRYTKLNPETIKKVYKDSHPHGE